MNYIERELDEAEAKLQRSGQFAKRFVRSNPGAAVLLVGGGAVLGGMAMAVLVWVI